MSTPHDDLDTQLRAGLSQLPTMGGRGDLGGRVVQSGRSLNDGMRDVLLGLAASPDDPAGIASRLTEE